MKFALRFVDRLPLALVYFVTASLAAGLTRFDGGVAFLWVATAFLIADLIIRPRAEWIYSIIPCALASIVATGLFGLGWRMALPFAIINTTEALAAAWLFRRLNNSQEPLGSLSWVLHFILCAGVASPLIGGVLSGVTLSINGLPGFSNGFNSFTARALGNLMVTPLALLVAQRSRREIFSRLTRAQAIEGALLLGLVIATSVLVFAQSVLPLLFLPILPVILATFRLGRGAAAAAVVLVALIGGAATIAGFGPVQLIDGWIGSRTQFFQLYLAATVLTVLPVAADLESRRRLHRSVRMSEARYRLLAEHSSDILLHLDRDGQIRYISPSIVLAGGPDPRLLAGQHSSVLMMPGQDDKVRSDYRETLAAHGQTRIFEYLAATTDGSVRWFESHARAVVDEFGNTDGVLSVLRDISARKAIEERLSADAFTDELTRLPNRRAFQAAVERRLVTTGQRSSDCLAVLDIDHFKVVNDTYGHAAGDEVLTGFARTARRMVRDRDMVARIGGEEFAILFPDTSVEQAMAICDRLRSEIAKSTLRASAAIVRVTVSGGVAAIGPDGLNQALATADRALYQAKRNGRDQLARAA